MQKTALLVIDMQNAYFNNNALADKKDSLIKNVNELIKYFQDTKLPIILVRTEHGRNKSTWTLNMLNDGNGYLFNDDSDVDFLEDLDQENTTQLIKTRDSAFYGTDLANRLHTLSVEQLVLAGVSTHSCILFSAADAYAANFRAILAVDAIASHDPNYHQTTLQMLAQEYRQKLLTNPEILSIIKK